MTDAEEAIGRASDALAAGDTAAASEIYEQLATQLSDSDGERAAFWLKLASGYATDPDRRQRLTLQAQGLLEAIGDQGGAADLILVRATIAEEAGDSLGARVRYTEAVQQLAFSLGETAKKHPVAESFNHVTVTLEAVIDKLMFCLNRLKDLER